MFVKSKHYGNYIVKVRIDLSAELGLDPSEDAYIVLRELPTVDVIGLKEAYVKGEREALEFFRERLPDMIVDHNLYEDENKKMDPAGVVALLFERAAAVMKVTNQYSDAIFPTSRSQTPGA